MATLPPLPPEGTPFLDTDTGRMNQLWRAWFRAFAPLLEEVADDIDGLAGDLGSLQVKDPQAHTIAKVKNVTARFHFRALWAGTIDSTYTDCQAGTATVRWQINGTNVGTQTNSISTTAQTRTHTTANTFAAGDVITYTITSASSCTEALLQCNITRSAS
jgi:hypothetical protein